MQFLSLPIVTSTLFMSSWYMLYINVLQVWHDVWNNVFKRRVYKSINKIKQQLITNNINRRTKL